MQLTKSFNNKSSIPTELVPFTLHITWLKELDAYYTFGMEFKTDWTSDNFTTLKDISKEDYVRYLKTIYPDKNDFINVYNRKKTILSEIITNNNDINNIENIEPFCYNCLKYLWDNYDNAKPFTQDTLPKKTFPFFIFTEFDNFTQDLASTLKPKPN
jgi:hypothetical protein